jgi:Fe-S oxidoreductase
MKHVRGVLVTIARLTGCTPAPVGESPKCSPVVENMEETRRNLHQLMKGKHGYCALYGVYTRCYTTWQQSSKRELPKGKQPRPQVLQLVCRGIPWVKKTEAQTFRRYQRKNQEAFNTHHGSQGPPIVVKAWRCYSELLCHTEVNWKGGWTRRRRGRKQRASATSGVF